MKSNEFEGREEPAEQLEEGGNVTKERREEIRGAEEDEQDEWRQ